MNSNGLSLPQVTNQNQQNMLPIAAPDIPGQAGIPQDASGQPGNSWLDFLLPTVGGIAGAFVPGLGETGISEAGGAALGQGLSDLLQGKSPGWDVPLTGGLGLLGSGLGAGATKLASGLIGGIGEDLATGGLNITKSQIANYAIKMGETPGEVLGRTGLMGANADTLDAGINNLQNSFDNIFKKNPTPLDNGILTKNMGNTVLRAQNAIPTSEQAMVDPLKKEFTNVFSKLPANPTLSDLTDAVQQYDSKTAASQFGSDQWGLNRTVGDTLRTARNEMADQAGLTGPGGQSAKQLGIDIMKLKNLSDLAAKRIGVGSAFDPFSLTNLVLGGDLGLYAHAMGANPLFGLLGPAARIAAATARSNPAIAGPLSNILRASGQGIAKATPAMGILGLLGGITGAAQLNSPSLSENPSQQQNSYGNPQPTNQSNGQQQNIINGSQNNSPLSFLGGNTASNSANIAQNGVNVNTTGQTGGISSFDGKIQFPTQLPQPASISNAIPGQTYTNDQYEADSQKIADAAAANANNPYALDALKIQQQSIDDKHASNTQRVDLYLQQQGLDAGAQDFIRTANPQWNALTQLHELLKTNGGQNLFQSFLQADPAMQTILAAKDPRYALMFNLLGQQKLAQARLAQGGVPRAYDLALSRLGAGQTAAANSAILEYAMGQFLNQYQQYAPLYGLSLQEGSGGTNIGNANTTQQSFPSNNVGNSALMNYLYNTLQQP